MALATAPLIALAAWIGLRAMGRPTPPRPTATTRAAPALLPSASAVGAGDRSELETYAGDGVYAYLDGGAEVYLHRGLKRILVTRYLFRPTGAPEYEIEAAAMLFKTPDGAAAQGADLTPADGNPVDGVRGAVATGTELTLVRGPWLLHLLSYAPESDVRTQLVRIATAWEAVIGRADEGR